MDITNTVKPKQKERKDEIAQAFDNISKALTQAERDCQSKESRQEKLREEIGLILYRVWADSKADDKEINRVDEVLNCLKSKDVVIKVDRELSKREWDDTALGDAGQIGYDMAVEDMAGCQMVEELI